MRQTYNISMLIYSAIVITPNTSKFSRDPWLESAYYQNPDAYDISKLTVVENVISGRKDIVALF